MACDLPKEVIVAIEEGKYKDWKLNKDQEEIFRDKETGQIKVYKVTVEKGKEKHILYFLRDGNLLKD